MPTVWGEIAGYRTQQCAISTNSSFTLSLVHDAYCTSGTVHGSDKNRLDARFGLALLPEPSVNNTVHFQP